MEILQQIFLSLICAFGIYAGLFISKNTKEEIKDGIRYFNLANVLVLIAILIIVLYQYFNIYLSLLISFSIGIIFKFSPKKAKNFIGVFIAASSLSFNNSYVLPSLIFAYNLFLGPILYYKNKTFMKSSFMLFIYFLFISILAYLIKQVLY